MMKSKTIAERTADIASRCGLPIETVERVIEARGQSILDDLKNGERVVDYGVFSMTPYFVSRAEAGGVGNKVAVRCEVSPRIIDALNKVSKYKIHEADDEDDGIVVKTLSAFM